MTAIAQTISVKKVLIFIRSVIYNALYPTILLLPGRRPVLR